MGILSEYLTLIIMPGVNTNIGIKRVGRPSGASWSAMYYTLKSGSTWYRREINNAGGYFKLWYSSDAGANWEELLNLDLTEESVLIDLAHVYRHRIKDLEYHVDQTLTATGYAGVENTDWENIYATSGSVVPTILTIGTTGPDYITLQEAFTDINAGNQTGHIVLRIIDDCTEIAKATLQPTGYLGNSDWLSVTIYPTVSGLSITGNLADDLILFNGCANVLIDGRVSQSGGASLTIENENAGGTTIHYTGVTNTQVLNCNVIGDIVTD